jgi:hypothetical protein
MCCYTTKTETWLTGPDGGRWQWYVKTGDSDQLQQRRPQLSRRKLQLLG